MEYIALSVILGLAVRVCMQVRYGESFFGLRTLVCFAREAHDQRADRLEARRQEKAALVQTSDGLVRFKLGEPITVVE